MAEAWKIRVEVSKKTAQAALLAHEDAEDWRWDWVLTGMEMADDLPEDWFVEAYLPHKPSRADRQRFVALFGKRPLSVRIEKIEDQDWLTVSQQGIEPIRAGRFFVRTPGFDPAPGTVDFIIPASQAFGTGHHATTAGCLAMLDLMRRRGVVVRNLIDVGTGTGLLAFAAMRLWPRALATASDIDPICAGVVADNGAANEVRFGSGPGALTMVIADGMTHPLLRARGPYDLLIANILAGPLIELAPDFATSMTPGGSLLLAGLLETQEPRVRAAYRRAEFRLAQRLVAGDWSVLWLRKRR